MDINKPIDEPEDNHKRTQHNKEVDYYSYVDWLNDTKQIKELQEAVKTAEEDLKRELCYNSAVFEIAQILDEYNKLYSSLSSLSDYLMRYGLQKPDVYNYIIMCRDDVLKSNTCFIEVANELYNIMFEKEKNKNV